MNQANYLINLNGYRCIAASLVLFSHTMDYAVTLGLTKKINRFDFPYWASLAVTFFFVLSGFLITFLLLKEKDEKSKINFKAFFKKRTYRIIPLYLLIILIGIFILPNFAPFISESKISLLNIILFFLLIPNLALCIYPPIPASHTWSIGVEEQFYFFWPFLIQYSKRLVSIFIIIIIVLVVLSNGISYLYSHYFNSDEMRILSSFLYMFRIPSMAIGGIGAYLFFYKKETLRKIRYMAHIQILTLMLIFLGLYFNVDIKYINHEVYSILFVILILTSVFKEKSIVNLEQNVMIKLGAISYGIYMYQPLANAIVYNCFYKFINNTNSSSLSLILFFFSNYAIIFIIASISYYFFELPIIRWSKKTVNKN